MNGFLPVRLKRAECGGVGSSEGSAHAVQPGDALLSLGRIRQAAKQIEHRASVSCGAEKLPVGRLDGLDCLTCELLTVASHAQLACP
jgi:hypothetical protein